MQLEASEDHRVADRAPRRPLCCLPSYRCPHGWGNVDGARLKAADSEPQNWLTLKPTIIFCA